MSLSMSNSGRMYWAILANAQECFKRNEQVTAHRHVLPLTMDPLVPLYCQAIAFQLLAKLSSDYTSAKKCLSEAASICTEMREAEQSEQKTTANRRLVIREIKKCTETNATMGGFIDTWQMLLKPTCNPAGFVATGPWGGEIECAWSTDFVPPNAMHKTGDPLEVTIDGIEPQTPNLFSVQQSV